MHKKNKRKKKGTCESCMNAVYCGEGCFMCLESVEGPKCVIDEYSPEEDYFWCSGKKYEGE